jgi:hypothetical protein
VGGDMSTINAGTTLTTAFTVTSDTTGALDLATGGTVRITLTSGGNLNFAGTAQRITGDFSNATAANRLLFQTSTTNGNSFVGAMPNGTATFGAYIAYNGSDPANSSSLLQGITSTDARLVSTFAGTGSYLPLTFYTGGSERVRIDTSGNVGIGGTADAGAKVHALGTYPTSGNVTQAFRASGTVPSGSTTAARGYVSALSTEAASFTVGNLAQFYANQGTIGATSTVTNQYGFFAESGLTGATNNYGFYSNIASGSNRWNFYAAGTAQNYFAGNTGIGATPPSNVRFVTRGSNTTSSDYSFSVQNSAPVDLMWVRNDGLIHTGLAASSPYNVTTGSAADAVLGADGVLRRSTSSLRYKTDVIDAAHGLADVLKLRSVTYKGINDGDKVFGGLIAEEVHDAGLTEFVAYDNEGRPDALAYGNMVALLVKAVQELKAELEALKAK